MSSVRINEFLKLLHSETSLQRFRLNEAGVEDINEVKYIHNVGISYKRICDISTPEEFMSMFNGEVLRVNNQIIKQYPNGAILNEYSLCTLKDGTKASYEYKDIAMMIHGVIHLKTATGRFSIDGVCDLILSYVKFSDCNKLIPAQNFFDQLYSIFILSNNVNLNPESQFDTTYNLSVPLFHAFIKWKKNQDIANEQNQMAILIDNHIRLNKESGRNKPIDQLICNFQISNPVTKINMINLLEILMPNYEQVIHIGL